MLPNYLRLAIKFARGGQKRNFMLGCIGVRSDGAVVASCNGSATSPEPTAHAEARTIRKLDRGAVVYVARIRRDNGLPAMAKPCSVCESKLRAKGVRKVYYTISENEWGTIDMV